MHKKYGVCLAIAAVTIVGGSYAALSAPGGPIVGARNPYSFGASCMSSGSWTQEALKQSKEIADAADGLLNDPECKKIRFDQIIREFKNLNQVLTVTGSNDSMSEEMRYEQLPNELSQLDAASRDPIYNQSPQMRSSLTAAQTQANFDVAALAAKTIDGQEQGPTFDEKTANMMAVGLETIANGFAVLPYSSKCLISDQSYSIISNALKMATSFVASGTAVGPNLSHAISGLISYVKSQRFANAIKHERMGKLWNSMQCLIETTTVAYCNNHDAQVIMKEFNNDPTAAVHNANDPTQLGRVAVQMDKKGNVIHNPGLYDKDGKTLFPATDIKAEGGLDSPYHAYSLLVREVPIISTWVQYVLRGVEPRTIQDGEYKINVYNNYRNFQMKEIGVIAAFNDQMINYNGALKSDQDKKNVIIEMIQLIKSKLGAMEASFEDFTGGDTNFYNYVVNPEFLPFYLIGRDKIPDEVGKGVQFTGPNAWKLYLQNYNNFREDFANPDHLVAVIKANLDKLLSHAEERANKYFLERFPADKFNLTDQSIVNPTGLSPYMAFPKVRDYLIYLRAKLLVFDHKFPEYGYDKVALSIDDTVQVLNRVMDAYKELDNLIRKGQVSDSLLTEMKRAKFPPLPPPVATVSKPGAAVQPGAKPKPVDPSSTDPDDNQAKEAMSAKASNVAIIPPDAPLQKTITIDEQRAAIISKILLVLYDNFRLLQLRNTFLSNRMSTYVQADLTMRMREGDSFDQRVASDAMRVTGQNLVQFLDQIYGGADRDGTLAAIDLAQAAQLNQMNLGSVEGLLNDTMIWAMDFYYRVSHGQVETDNSVAKSGFERWLLDSYEDAHHDPLLTAITGLFNMAVHGNRYPTFSFLTTNSTVIGRNDDQHSYAKTLAKLCIQSLAFSDHERFDRFCRGTMLDGYFKTDSPQGHLSLSMAYDAVRGLPDNEDNHWKYVCSYRDYLRRNHVYYLVNAINSSSIPRSQ